MGRRINVLFTSLLVIFFIIWLRLFYWQIIRHDTLQILADSQHFLKFEIPPVRGEIISSDGTALVTNQTAYLVFAEKKRVEDQQEFIKTIAPIIGETEASIAATLQEHEVWVPIKHQIDEEKMQKLRNLQLPGLGFEREDRRYYPESSMAAHLLGFVGKNNEGKAQGYFGLEGAYDKELRGQSGYLRQEKDAVGNPILIGNIDRVEPKNGRSLVLYLDKSVQFIAEEKLKEGMGRYGAKAGTVTIMDPKTGGILASASFPSYDPGLYQEFPDDYYKNPVIADSYEPGSTFKPLVIAEAIDKKMIQASDTFEEKGQVRIGEYSIKTWNNEYHGTLTITQILEYSSNVGMVFVADKMGNETIRNFIKNIGFGELTGVDLQEENAPALRPDDSWYEIDYKTASFGQGIAVTPMQMVRAISSIANNGLLMEPKVVKSIVENDGRRIDLEPILLRRLFSENTTNIVKEMMIASVEHGEAKWKVPKGYRIAGKTGTAQIPVAGRYDTEKTIASFVGFAPADDPKFVMLVTLHEPESSPWGSETAAPLFFQIASELLLYYGIPPR